MATDGPPEGKVPTTQYQAQKKDMNHLARPPEDGLHLAPTLVGADSTVLAEGTWGPRDLTECQVVSGVKPLARGR
jgi:hypothetical protein